MAVLCQASWVHVYLSFPFILGWSLIEAMACGCCIVGSRGMPVSEVIQDDGLKAFLIPMNAPKLLAEKSCSCWLIPKRVPGLGSLLASGLFFMTSA